MMTDEEILNNLSKHDLTEEEILYFYGQLYFTNYLNNEADDKIQEFHKQQKENRDNILTEIAKVMLSYSIIDSVMSIGDSDKFKLRQRLNTLIQNKVQEEANKEVIFTKELLKSTGSDKYNSNNYINNIGGTKSKKNISKDSKIIEDVINEKVDNKIWSDRLWDNKNELQKDLKEDIRKFLDGKISVNDIERNIKKKYDSNAYNTKRLVQDNVARVQEGINAAWREDNGVKYVMYLATLCNNTCSNCSQYDGKTYPIGREPVKLPQHPFCKCDYANVPSKDWKPKTRLDNETKERVDWQSYEEWLGKLEQNQEVKITKKDVNNDYSVYRTLVNSKEYHNKFEGLPLNKSTKENLYIESKRILEHRDGTYYEDLVVLDFRTGKEIVSNRSTNNDLRTGLSRKDYDKVVTHNGDIILLHNHPGGGRPSIADILTAFKQKNVKASIVVGHDGSVSIITNINRKVDIEKIYNEYYNKYKQLGYEGQHAKLKATDDIYNLNVFKYIEKQVVINLGEKNDNNEIRYLIHDDRPDFYPGEIVEENPKKLKELTEEEKKEFKELKKKYGIR